MLVSGLFLVGAAAALPVPLQQAPERRLRIDEFAPAFHFSEFHTIAVRATPDRAFQAIRKVTPEEIRFFRTLTWIRSPRLAGPSGESILDAAARRLIYPGSATIRRMWLAAIKRRAER